MTSKYDPLKQHLIETGYESIQMSFSEIERVIGVPLPMSARSYDAWWLDTSPNKNHSHAKAWLEADRQIESVDRNAAIVNFSSLRGRAHAMPTSEARGSEPRLLESVEYPIDKVALLERALGMEVPDTVRDAIGRLPDGTFYSRSEFVAAVEAIAFT